jgi:hypothetical protein
MIKRKIPHYLSDTGVDSVVTSLVGRSMFVSQEWSNYSDDYPRIPYTYLNSIDENGLLVKYSVDPADCDGYEIDYTEMCFFDYWTAQYNKSFNAEKINAEKHVNNVTIKDRVVKIVRGRTNKGTVGRTVVVITRPYRMGYKSIMKVKLGIATSPVMIDVTMPNGRVFKNHRDMVWVWAQNCEVEVPDAIDIEKIRATAYEYANTKTADLRRVVEDYNNKQQKAA